MAKSQYLEFTIWLTDAAAVATLNAMIDNQDVPGLLPYVGVPSLQSYAYERGILRAPDAAAAEFAPYNGDVPLGVIDAGDPIPSGGGYITSPHILANRTYPTDVDVFEKSSGWWIFGSDTQFYWGGRFAFAGQAVSPPVGTEPTSRENEFFGFQRRHFVWANQVPPDGDGPSTHNLAKSSRMGARLGDGIGTHWASTTAGPTSVAWTYASLIPTVTQPRQLWHRIYIRPLAFGGTVHRFWRLHQQAVSNTGFQLGIDATGQLAIFIDNSSSVDLSSTVGQLVLGQWARIDIFAHAHPTGTNGSMFIEVRLNGAQVGSASRDMGGLEINRWFQGTAIGNLGATVSDHIFDFGPWISADCPKTLDSTIAAWDVGTTYVTGNLVRMGSVTYYALVGSGPPAPKVPGAVTSVTFWRRLTEPLDVTVGSHVTRPGTKAFGPDHASWGAFDWRVVNQRPAQPLQESHLSTVPSADFQVELDMALVDALPGSQGWVAFMVYMHSTKAGAANGSLGWKVGGDPEALTTVLQSGSWKVDQVTYSSPASVLEPNKGLALLLKHRRSVDAGNARVYTLGAVVECIGVFGPEDQPVDEDAPAAALQPAPLQLSEFPWCPWARQALPLGPVIIVGGTYTGNAVGQDLTFKAPPVWLWIRPLTGDTGGVKWWASMLTGHQGTQHGTSQGPLAHFLQNVAFTPGSPDDDQQGEYRARIGGGNAQSNANAVVYQYIAFCDPAGRYARAWAGNVGTTRLPWNDLLQDPNFQAEAGFFVHEGVNQTTTASFLHKGPGHGADDATNIAGTAVANALTFGLGFLTLRAGWVNTASMENLCGLLFRRHDGNDHPDEGRVMFMGSYVGDGTASRTVSIAPTTGRRPMFLIVVPSNAAAFMRDPSHTTNTSTNPASGASSTTAITGGGPDSFSVGSTLNSNGITYHYFGFPGGTDAGNGGWSQNGEQVPVPADSLNPDDWEEPDIIDAEEPLPPDTTAIDPGALSTDIAVDCVDASTRIVNLALAEIGISKTISSLATDTSQEGFTARLVYKTMVDTVLRDYVWHFTREYAELEAIAGTVDNPVNPDWTYAYRLPVDCLRVRRVCVPPMQRRYSTEPVPYDQRSELLGQRDILLCNEPGHELLPLPDEGDPITIEIEYSKRIDCPARVTDSQFRECLVYRLAAGLAKALGRDAKDAERCMGLYNARLPKAKVQHANDQEVQRPDDADPDWILRR